MKEGRDDFANLRRANGCPESESVLDTLTLRPQREARAHFPRLTTYFVGQEQAGHGFSIRQGELAVQVLFPSLAIAEGRGVGNIKHNNAG